MRGAGSNPVYFCKLWTELAGVTMDSDNRGKSLIIVALIGALGLVLAHYWLGRVAHSSLVLSSSRNRLRLGPFTGAEDALSAG